MVSKNHYDKQICPVRNGVHHFRLKTGRCQYCRKIVFDGHYRYTLGGKLVPKKRC